MKFTIATLILMTLTGCGSLEFALSQGEGFRFKATGLAPTVTKLISVQKENGTGFDLYHSQSLDEDRENIGIEAPEPEPDE